MDRKSRIDPSKINKPIQLLGAWLAGLVLVNGGFLGTAITIETPTWVRGLLVIASVINVPIFLSAIFLLQTKFRPEMQEDSYYHDYLLNMSGEPKAKVKVGEALSIALGEGEVTEVEDADWSQYRVMVNPNLKDVRKILNHYSMTTEQLNDQFHSVLASQLCIIF